MKQSRFNLFSAALFAVAASSPAFAVDRVRNATANNLIDAAAWDDGTTAVPTSTDRAVWNGTSVGGATTLGGDSSWSGILISAGTPASGPLFTNAVNGTPFTLTLGSGGIDLNGGTSTNRGISFESNTKLDLSANQTWKLGAGQSSANIVVSSVISGSGSLEITRASGALNYAQFNGANTYSGGLTLGANARVLLGTSSVVSGASITSGPTGTGTLAIGDGSIISSSSGSGRDVASTGITVSGNFTVGEATTYTGRIRLNGALDLGNATRIATITNGTATGTSGNARFGFATLTGSTIGNSISNGTLSVQSLATGGNLSFLHFANQVDFLNNSGLILGNNVVTTIGTSSAFGNNAADKIPNLTIQSGGVLDMSDQATGLRSFSIASLSGSGGVTSNSTLTGTSTLTVNGTNSGAVNNTEFSGTIANGATVTLALTKTGPTSQTLSGTNTYTGKTTVSGGVLKIAKTTALYNNTPASWTDTNLQVDSAATLAFNVGGTGEFTSSNIQSLVALGTATGGFKSGAKIGIDTTNASGGLFTYSNVLANPNSGVNTLGLRKLGTGTLVLDQANTFSGGTIIDAGTLRVTQPASLGGGGSITVNPGAALEVDFSALGAAGTIGRVITGTGTIDATPANTFQLSFSSSILTTYAGTLNVKPSPGSNARVDINGLIASGSTINIDTGATARLVASGGTYTGVTINVKGSGGSGPGALRLQDNTLDSLCAVNLTGDASIGGFTITSTIDAVISDGGNVRSLSKVGDSTLVLNAVNTYGGDTNVNGGTLRIAKPYLADASDVTISSTGVLDLNFDETSGQVTDTVATLTIAGVQKAAGVYGATGSGAAIIDDTHFAGIGTLTVTSGPATSAYDTWATGFGLSGGNAAFDADPDNDGVKNGLEWILGGNPNTSSTAAAPAVSRDPSGNLVLTFTRREDSITEGTLTLEYGPDLASFANSYVIDADGGTDANGVVVSINQTASPDAVTVTIPPAAVPGGRVFARLKAVRN